MNRHLPFSLLLLVFLPLSLTAQGQESDPGSTLEEVTIQKKLLPYTNPLIQEETMEASRVTVPAGIQDREVLQRILDVYQIHYGVVEALIQEDPVAAESGINRAISSLQVLMDDFPEVRTDNRFAELYRTVMAEYREFYGISEPMSRTEGEVFAVQEELMSLDDDWMIEGFVLPEDLTNPSTEVPLVYNEHVTRHMMYYTQRRPDVMEIWLERSEKYFPMMEEIFAEEGVPRELIHMSMIESGLVPTAQSWASAVGLWQFIRPTGAMYGLEVNWWIDERRDPVKATRAAAQHLRDLYNIWEDWHLAMANYNISPRGLRRAINAAGGVEDYWVALPYLPRETQGYVPGFIAATTVAMNPEAFGFERNYGGERWSYDVVEVDGLMPLDRLAEAAGMTTQELKEYNPELLRWATPPGTAYPLKIPSGIREDFLAAYETIPQDERAENIAMHTVSSGENLGYIARRYGTTVQALFASNENLSTTIHPGQTLVVPVENGSTTQIAADRPSNSSGSTTTSSSQQTQSAAPANTTPLTYTVKTGDTIGHIAEWYDVRSWQIRGWNGIGDIIRVGQRLTVHVENSRVDFYRQIDRLGFAQKQELQRQQRQGVNIYAQRFGNSGSSSGDDVVYTVQRNDTLSDIARSFGVSISQLQQLNDLTGTRIYAGQTLKIQSAE